VKQALLWPTAFAPLCDCDHMHCQVRENMESNKRLRERSSSSVCELALQNAGPMCALKSTDNNTVIIAQLRGVSKVLAVRMD